MKNIAKRKILEDLRCDLMSLSYPLSFKDDYSFYSRHGGYNCLAYSLGLKVKDNYVYLKKNGLFLYTPGTISYFKNGFVQDADSLVRAFLDDCNVLNLSYEEVDISSPLEDDSNKVAIYIKPHKFKGLEFGFEDFHFARQNKDGLWSHKTGYLGDVSYVRDVKNIPEYNFLMAYSLKKKR